MSHQSNSSEKVHTPGPWQVLPEESDKPYIRVRGTRLGGRYKVANVIALTYEGVHEREAEETRANARLIVAAPDLLSIARRWAALDAGEWNVERHASEKAELLADTNAAIQRATT